MAKKGNTGKPAVQAGRPSALLDTRVVYCGVRRVQPSRLNVEQLARVHGKYRSFNHYNWNTSHFYA